MKHQDGPCVSLIAGLLLTVAGAAFAATGAGTPATAIQPSTPAVTLSGTLGILWGDPVDDPAPDRTSAMQFTLRTDDGASWELELTEAQRAAAGGLAELFGSRVSVEGRVRPDRPSAVTLDRLTRLGPAGAKDGTRGTYGAQPYAWVLLRFADDSSTPQTPSWFTTQALGPNPSLDDFWREVSFNNINLLGSEVTNWLTLPHNRSYYVYDVDPNDPGDEVNFARVLADAVALADPYLYFPFFVGIHFCFNGELDGWAWGGGATITADGQTRWYGTTYLPHGGWANQSIVAHEGGHALGLPHSSGMYGADYDSYWDTMSHHCGTCTHTDPVYGNVANQVNAYDKNRLGWIHPLHSYILPTTPTVASVWLNDLVVVPPTGRYLQLQMPFVANPADYLMVERRRFTGYDVNVAGESVVIHEVVPTRDKPAQVIDNDMNGNPNDDAAMWEPGETFWFSGATAAMLVTVEEKDASGSRVTVTNAARVDTYVNLANVGSEDGSSTHPWNTFTEGSGAVYPTGTVHIAPASYNEGITLRKSATYERWGISGVVTIGM